MSSRGHGRGRTRDERPTAASVTDRDDAFLAGNRRQRERLRRVADGDPRPSRRPALGVDRVGEQDDPPDRLDAGVPRREGERESAVRPALAGVAEIRLDVDFDRRVATGEVRLVLDERRQGRRLVAVQTARRDGRAADRAQQRTPAETATVRHGHA